jgi:hypothetical protein
MEKSVKVVWLVSNGKTIIKTQYSNKDIVFKKLQQGETESSLSIGNDLKAAATDCKNVLQKLESLLIFIIKKILGNKSCLWQWCWK